jgi:hypothetical protein
MSASLSITSIADVFPVGTTVGAYPRSNWPSVLNGGSFGSAAPPGAATATGVVASAGTLSITGLAYGTRYVLSADIGGGVYKYREATTPSPSGQYQSVIEVGGKRWDAQAAGTFVLFEGGAGTNGSSGSVYGAFYIDPSDFGLSSAVLNLRASILTNATAPACNFVFTLNPIGSLAGGAASVAQTSGTAVTGSTCTHTTPASGTGATVESGDFACPTAGFYVIQHTISTNMAANSAAVARAQLFIRSVTG